MTNKFRKLIIIGNGFDRWQGLPTSYDHFKEYYRKHILEIVKARHVKYTVDDKGIPITPVERIFGDITHPTALPDEFFWNFEAATALLDDQGIVNCFDKSNKGLYDLHETVREAKEILKQIFGNWITSIEIEDKESGFSFDDSCYCINFNYTDTLEKRFHVDKSNDYHIHGDAAEPESIIFGHSTHPELAFPELMEQKMVRRIGGGKSKRLRGLYLIEDALYETDKHIQDNIDGLCKCMILGDVHLEDFTDIYVLGHSFAETDFEYIDFLVKATQADCNMNELSALWKVRNIGMEKLLDEENLLEFIQMNIIYATRHRKRALKKENVRFPILDVIEKAIFGRNDVITDGDGVVHDLDDVEEKSCDAVYKRFIMEQAARTKEVIEELCMMKGIKDIPSHCYSVMKVAEYIGEGCRTRIKDARWHISYYSDQDKEQIESVMRRCGCTNYELFPSIEKCIEDFRIK